jgi:Flp pilus assembly protein TadD
MGKALLALGQVDQAQSRLEQAYQVDSTNPDIVKDIGNCLHAKERILDAADAYQCALSIDPDNVPALNNMGLIMKLQGPLRVLPSQTPTDPEPLSRLGSG